MENLSPKKKLNKNSATNFASFYQEYLTQIEPIDLSSEEATQIEENLSQASERLRRWLSAYLEPIRVEEREALIVNLLSLIKEKALSDVQAKLFPSGDITAQVRQIVALVLSYQAGSNYLTVEEQKTFSELLLNFSSLLDNKYAFDIGLSQMYLQTAVLSILDKVVSKDEFLLYYWDNLEELVERKEDLEEKASELEENGFDEDAPESEWEFYSTEEEFLQRVEEKNISTTQLREEINSFADELDDYEQLIQDFKESSDFEE